MENKKRSSRDWQIEDYLLKIIKKQRLFIKELKNISPSHKVAYPLEEEIKDLEQKFLEMSEETNMEEILGEEIEKLDISEISEENEVEIIQKLIEKRLDINSVDDQGNTLLHHSVMKGNLEVIQKLLELGSKVDAKNEDDETPLHIAAKIEREYDEDIAFKISVMLLEKGANPNIKDELGNTVVHYAARNGNLRLLEALFKKGGDINATNNFNWSVLHSAASAIVEGIECWEIVEWLIKSGASTTIKSEMGSSVYNIFREKDWTYAECYAQIVEDSHIKK